MKHIILSLLITVCFLSLLLSGVQAQAERSEVPTDVGKKHIDLAFAIDVSGSMQHIIAATQQKIWAIVNEMLKSQPTPIVRVGLIAYRGEQEECFGGTGFQVWDLTDDLDKVYGQLMALSTSGGHRECVGRAIYETAHSMSWNKSQDSLKVLFVLGNEAANQDSNQAEFGYKISASEAIRRGIQINTVYCQGGGNPTPEWAEIARLADGTYTTIGLEGKITRISTPMDKELAELQQKLSQTVVGYGNKGFVAQAEMLKAQDAVGLAPATVQADRAQVQHKAKRGRIGTWDLIDAVKEGRADLKELKDEELPEEMQKMTPEERQAHLENKQKEREEIQQKIKKLTKKREAYLKEEMAKLKDKDAFDQVIMKTLREQAKRKGFKFEETENE